jgi:hypothetical protein
MLIRWIPDTIDLERFPERTQAALRQLKAGSFAEIASSVDTQLMVKRLTDRAFQLGLAEPRAARTAQPARCSPQLE